MIFMNTKNNAKCLKIDDENLTIDKWRVVGYRKLP